MSANKWVAHKKILDNLNYIKPIQEWIEFWCLQMMFINSYSTASAFQTTWFSESFIAVATFE